MSPSRPPSSDPVLSRGRRALRWVPAGLALGLAAGGAIVFSTVPQYTAKAAVELSKVTPTVDLLPSAAGGTQVTVDTDAQLITSDEVINAAARAADRTTGQARSAIDIAARPLSRVLVVSYVDRSPEAARAGAETAASTFLKVRERLVVQRTRDYLQRLSDAPVAPNVGADTTTSGLSASSLRLANLQERATELNIELPGPGGILEHARITSTANRGSVEVPLASGGALGVLLGFTIGLLRSRGRRSSAGMAGTSAGSSAGMAATPRMASRPGRRRLVRRMAGWTLVLTVAGLGAGTALSSLISVPVLARTSIEVKPLPGNAYTGQEVDNTADVRTEAALPLSDTVLDRVAASYPGPIDLTSLHNRVSSEVLSASEVIGITVRSATDIGASRLVEQIAETTLDVRQERSVAAYARRTAILERQIKNVDAALAKATAGTSSADGVDTEVRVLSARLVGLRDQMRSAPATSTNPGSVVDTTIGRDSSREVLRAVVIGAGAAIGALLGLCLGRWLPRRRGAERAGHRRSSRSGSAQLQLREARSP